MFHFNRATASVLIAGASLCSLQLVHAAEVPSGVKLAKEQVIHINNDAEPQSLDPQKVSGLYGGTIDNDLFEGLVIASPEGGVRPGVAKDWHVSKDGKTYTFHLREDARWSDGSPVTAEDFVYSWRRAVDPNTAAPYAGYVAMANLKNAQAIIDGKKSPETLGVKAINAHTLQVTLAQPVSYFVQMLQHHIFSPVPERIISKWGDHWTRPEHMVSNGAYKLDNWVVNEKIVLKPNPEYWDHNNTVVQEVDYLPITDEQAGINRFMAGGVDVTSVPAMQVHRMKKLYPQELHHSPSLTVNYLSFNTRKPPFNDVRVRRALSYAIDREVIVKDVLMDVGYQAAYSFTPLITHDFIAPKLPWSQWTQKQRDQKARKLLKEAGYSASHPWSFTPPTPRRHR